jgi:hypothetical protein
MDANPPSMIARLDGPALGGAPGRLFRAGRPAATDTPSSARLRSGHRFVTETIFISAGHRQSKTGA